MPCGAGSSIISLNDDLVNPRKVVTARLTESGQWVSETNTLIYFRLRRFFNTRPLSSMHYYYCCKLISPNAFFTPAQCPPKPVITPI